MEVMKGSYQTFGMKSVLLFVSEPIKYTYPSSLEKYRTTFEALSIVY